MIMSRQVKRKGRQRSILSVVLASIPVLALTAGVPFANRLEPRILGFPFLIVLSYIVYRRAADSESTEMLGLQLVVQGAMILAGWVYQIFFLGKYGATPGVAAITSTRDGSPGAFSSASTADSVMVGIGSSPLRTDDERQSPPPGPPLHGAG